MQSELPTVFVVEDEESFIEALEIGLKREGFKVHVARDGAEALSMFDSVKPDIVLLDVMLPKLSGTDVCRELRKKSQVPIIMVSAKGSEIDTVVGLEVGADDYIVRPVVVEEVVRRVRAAPHASRRRLRCHRWSGRVDDRHALTRDARGRRPGHRDAERV